MLRHRIAGMLALLTLAGLAACAAGGNEITDVVYENLRALKAEEMDSVMLTIHESSPAYAATKDLTQQLFALYDLDYELEVVELLSSSDDQAQVRVVQVTKKVSGPEFRDNRIEAVHTLRKSPDGRWKIFETRIDNIEYLN